jgi:DNA-binding Lrp family transcriptional regulator
MSEFTALESAVLNTIQNGVPLEESPFQRIATDLDASEEEVIQTVARLKSQNIIRNISGIFNGESLGFHLSLVAFKVAEDEIEHAAKYISSHPGVSHNYLRRHPYNIWFTLAVENSESFEDMVALIAKKAHALDYLIMRNEKLLKIGLKLQIGDAAKSQTPATSPTEMPEQAPARKFTEEERLAIRLLQTDLPIVDQPFALIVKDTAMTEKRLLELAGIFQQEKSMRRYAAVLRHMKAGFTNNAMTAWKLNDAVGDSNTVVRPFIEQKAVTHLYLRTLYPGRWEHPLFAMVHARSPEELNEIINELSRKSGLNEYIVLDSLREFKKERINYFSDMLKNWKGNTHD